MSQQLLSRSSWLLLCLLGADLLSSGAPRPLGPLSRDNSDELTQEDYEVHFPSFSLPDWGIQPMSAQDLKAAANSKAYLNSGAWLSAPKSHQSEGVESRLDEGWPAGWSQQSSSVGKRNMVVADDAAFREKSKLLTTMERQKWLNSYMQKLLVVHTKLISFT
ncbi:hypothetical protein NHX12_020055 [Muraenolepis orangiensis]|uniref:Tuberoinfundibular peptide of 39 residues n=1 Tax=Muraenolepis orangiensis TaxID=630683 RepID=A0A9Q0IWL8_9TELE|nr:hypothetical protein NHX12_020055 [Muraenolepis orangiensis]